MTLAENTTLSVAMLPPDISPSRTHAKEEKERETGAGRGPCWGARHGVALLALFGIILDFMMQTILAVTIVAMVGRRSVAQQEEVETCAAPDAQNTTEVMEPGEFDWDEKTQGFLQGALNFGCAIVSLPSGRVVEVYGGKRMFGLMVTSASALSLLSPAAARTSIWFLVVVRVAQGMSVGGLLPAVNTVLVLWFPPEERAMFMAITLTGMNIGTVLCMTMAGWLCGLDWLGGWPAPFYVVGAAGLVWGVLWFGLTHRSPEEHPRISKEELHYILGGGKRARKDQTRRFPWGQFLRCPLVWVQAFTCMGDVFSFYIINTMMPTYLAYVQGFDLRNAGVMAALPYLLACPVSVCWGLLVGCLTVSSSLTKKQIKQLSTVVGFYGPSLCMVGICLAECRKEVVVALLILSVCASSCNFTGIFTTYQDLCPTFCSTFNGFVGMLTSVTGMAGPALTGLMINDAQTLEAWRNVFITSAVIYFVSCTLYLAVTPVRQQEWDNPTPTAATRSSCSPNPLLEPRAGQEEPVEC